ncbi:transcription elongation factor [Psychromonas sp. psych-6C06]|uniref:GreA/GreB family elongation factor n=1 Tax=Psychromonas sp. psych-6C06 TaxID=2058089 RepID=UPI000C342EA2|nr:GreA/GreB family elongation factor [Psychromonas sp. psych-6C06]PKF62680.1 transcription elongation factor [Psychromonas sp. psych-6C06]
MNKKLLLKRLLATLEEVHQCAVDAAKRAYDTATDNENVAENQYDTLALEASYLAHGQSVRVEQCAQDINAFKALNINNLPTKVSAGALVRLLDDNDHEKWLFFAPTAGGLSINFADKTVVVVTASSPLGAAINQAEVGQEITINIASKTIHYEVMEIY